MAKTFHPFLRLPLTLQADILGFALPQNPLLISAFWKRNDEDSTEAFYKLCLPTTESFRTLQNVASLRHPLLILHSITLPHTAPTSERPILGTSSQTPDRKVPISLKIFFRHNVDILYVPFPPELAGVGFDIQDFLGRKENRRIKKLAITFKGFNTLERTQDIVSGRLKSPFWELILGLKELEVLYVIGGDENNRVLLPLIPLPRIRPSSEWAELGRTANGMWTGSEEVKLVGLGEGTFQGATPGWAWCRGGRNAGSYQRAH